MRLKDTLNEEVNRHCSEYPQDVTYLGQIFNIDIVPTNTVYTTETSNKYHSNPHCSGIKKSVQMELEEAVERGFKPCKRCYK